VPAGPVLARLLLARLLLAGLVLAGCGASDRAASTGPAGRPPTSPATTAGSGPTAPANGDPDHFWLPTAPASELVGQGDVPDLPLRRGIPDYSGDGGRIRGPAPGLPGVDRTLVCGQPLLDQELPSTGRLVATGTGPEFGQVHQVVAYADAASASAQLDHVRRLVEGCPRDPGDRDALGWSAMLWRTTQADTGHGSVTVGNYLEGALGIGSLQVTRVGRGLLIVELGGETSPADLEADAVRLTALTRDLAPLLCPLHSDSSAGSPGLPGAAGPDESEC
jgi:hypothetical protein